MRLIDADELEEMMYQEVFVNDSDMCRWDSGRWIRYKLFEDTIFKCPTIEAEPIRHGHWVDFESDKGGHIQYCSSCGVCCLERTDYCPHCGAKMDEVSEEQ